MKKCTNCGTENRDEARFCSGCGQRLANASPAKSFCDQCGKQIDAAMRFCPHCGAPQGGQSTSATGAPISNIQAFEMSGAFLEGGTVFLGGNDHLRNLGYLVIPEGITAIGNSACSGWRNLKSVVFPNSLKRIGDYAFSDCDSLNNVVIPVGVERIGNCAFRCASMTAFTFQNSEPPQMVDGLLFGKALDNPQFKIYVPYYGVDNYKRIDKYWWHNYIAPHITGR